MKILIAEDEKRIVNILCKFLEDRGLLVDYALDGKEALRLIKAQNHDIVFLDLNMPKLSGVEVLKYIKENNIKTKVIILTGYPDVDGQFCLNTGADEYLEKPINLKVIWDTIVKYTPA